MPASYQQQLNRLVLDSWSLRVVATVYGLAQDAPATDEARTRYCSYVADLLRDNPEIDDVAIWNDPNDGTFWGPQFTQTGVSVAPAAYEELLADCYDAAHAVRPSANLIAVAASKSSTLPGAFTLAWHPPAAWFAKLGAAYKASRRPAHLRHPRLHPPPGRLGRAALDAAPRFGGDLARRLPGP